MQLQLTPIFRRLVLMALTIIGLGAALGQAGHLPTLAFSDWRTTTGAPPPRFVTAGARSRQVSAPFHGTQPLDASIGQETPSQTFLPWVGSSAGAEVHVVARLGGTTRALMSHGDLVYAGIDNRVAVFEAGRDGAIHPLGETDAATSNVVALAASDSALFVADEGASLRALNLDDPERPRVVAARHLGGTIHDLAVVGDVLAVSSTSDRFTGIVLFSTATDGAFEQIGEMGTTLSLISVAGAGSRLVAVADDSMIAVIDITDEGLARIIAQVDLPVAGASCVAVVDGAAVVGHPGGLIVVDMADPSQPSVGAELPLPEAATSVAGAAEHVIVGSRSGLSVVHVATAQELVPQARVAVPEGLLDVSADTRGVIAYGGGPNHQVVAWDISNASSPSSLGAHVGLSDAVDLTVVRDGLLVVTNDPPGVAMVTGLPDAPLRVADTQPYTRITDPIAPGEVHLSARLYYGFVLLFDSLTSYDTSVPSRIEPRRTRAQPWAGAMAGSGDYLYIARDGLVIVNALAASDLPEVGRSAETVGTGKAIAVEGGLVYLGQRSIRPPANPTDLWVFDVASPRTPVRIGVGSNIADPESLAVVNGYVYVSGTGGDELHGLWVYDATNPAAIMPVGTVLLYPTAGLSRQVVRDENVLYLVEEAIVDPFRGTLTGRHGVHVIDVSDPKRAESITFVPFVGPIGGIAAQDGLLYVAGRTSGLFVVDVNSSH